MLDWNLSAWSATMGLLVNDSEIVGSVRQSREVVAWVVLNLSELLITNPKNLWLKGAEVQQATSALCYVSRSPR